MSLADAKPFAVAHWSLDEASGTRTDSVGSNDLTDNNTVVSGTGKFGNAADFEVGNEEYLSVADNAVLSLGDTDWMIRAWINIESLPHHGSIAGKSAGGSSGYWLRASPSYVSGQHRLNFSVHDGTSVKEAIDGTSLSTGTWYLVHAWHDATNNQIGVSVNGGTAVTESHSTGVADNSDAFTVGRVVWFYSYFDGIIDDLVVLDGYILDADERTEDYNSGVGVSFDDWDLPLSDAVSSAVAHWKLDETSGTRNDSVGTNHLTDTNTVLYEAGKFGNAADFERDNNERLTINDNADMSSGNIDFMFRAWIKLESVTGAHTILSKWAATPNVDREYWLYFYDSPNRFIFQVDDGTATYISVSADNFGAPSTGVWYLIHAWHDSANNQIGISVNGGTANTVSWSGGVLNGTAPFRIGANAEDNGSGGNHHFDGLIDDVVFLKNYLLTPGQKLLDYNNGNGVPFAAWNKTGVAGCKLWLAADFIGGLADGDPVSTWIDYAEGNSPTQTSTARPTYKTNIINGLPVVRFDGSNDYLTWGSAFTSGFTAAEVFIVFKLDVDPPGADAQTGFWNFGGDASAAHFPYTDGNIYDEFGTTARKNTGNPTLSLSSDFRIYNVSTASGNWTSRIDGVQHYTTGTNTVGWDIGANPRLGTDANAAMFLDGDIAEIIIYDNVLSSGDRTAVMDYLEAKYFGGGGGTTLTVEGGSYSISGSAVSLKWGHKVPVDSGSYTLTGASVGLKRGYPIVVGAGSYSISGSAITFKHDWKLPIGLGSYTLTGSSVGLKRGYPIIVDAGSYTLSGSSVGLKRGYPLSVGTGSYILSGSDVDLITTLKIEVGAGSYTITGASVTLSLAHKLSIDSGSYTIGGSSVGLKRGYPIVIGSGSYSLTGSNVNLKFGHVVTVGSGIYTITGASVNLIDSGEDARLDVESGSYSLTGSNVNLQHGHKLIVGSASYTLTGSTVGLGFGPHVGIGSGSYIINGSSVGLRYGRSLIVGSGNYAISGSNITFFWHHDLDIGSGSYIITGGAVNLFIAQAIVGSGKIVLCNVFVPGPQQVFTHVPGPVFVEV